jgi:hypothetical protein
MLPDRAAQSGSDSFEVEAEITDEMIDAGIAAYEDCDPRFERVSSIVICVFRAMARIAPSNKLLDHDRANKLKG